MVKKRYFAVAGIAAALYMLFALSDCYVIYDDGNWAEYPFVIAGVFAVVAFAFSAFAVICSLKKSRLLLDIAVGLNTAVSIYCYVLVIASEAIFEGVAWMLGAIIICVLYFVGIYFKREAKNKQYLFDVCCVLAFCVLGALLFGGFGIVFALAIFMVYCFVNTRRYVWYIIAGLAGGVCLSLCIVFFVGGAAVYGFVALAGAAYAIVYFVISYLRVRGAGNNVPTAEEELSTDDMRQLEQLHELMLQGIITEEQFQSQKAKILGGK